jgi:glucose/arabinose dehydrogenase
VVSALVVTVCAAAALGLWLFAGDALEPVPPQRIDTSAYRLHVDRWALPAGTRRASLAIAGENLVLASNDGSLYRAPLPAPGRDAPLEWDRLPFSVPIEMAILERKYGAEWGFSLGMRDIFVDDRPDGTADLYLLYGVYVHAGDCIVTRVGRILGFLGQGPASRIETIYETAPCLPIVKSVDRAGGRLAIRDGQMLVAIGTPQDDRRPQDMGDPGTAWAQQWDKPFGKVIRIDLASRAVSFLTTGHRNPQGLFWSEDGRVWLTEHGPRGGDELNLLRAGANYGWPAVTYGTDYPRFTWPPAQQQGRHADYERPVHAWVPSVGVSQLVQLESADFGRWQGDLLITSLSGQTLYRARLEDDRVVFAEPIPLGHRLRDIAVAGGAVYVVTDFDLLLRLEPDYARD